MEIQVYPYVLENFKKRLRHTMHPFQYYSLQEYGDVETSVHHGRMREASDECLPSLPELKSPRDWRHERTRRSQMTARSARGVLIIPFCTADSRGLET